MDPAVVAQIRAQWGLDQPLPLQYLRFVGNAVTGDLGRSFITRASVTLAVLERLGPTAYLGAAALLLATVVGVGIGMIAAVYRNTWIDLLAMLVALIGVSIPIFWLAVLLMYLFSVKWQILPASGFGDGDPRYLIMPAFALGSTMTAIIARITRSAMLGVIRAEYIQTARAKGLAERTVIFRHAFRNALVPVVTILGVEAGGVLSGAVITETIFGWPGIGRLLVDSIGKRDMPMVQGVVIFFAFLFALVNLVTDLTYGLVDPRVRYA
jgi:ABC-type dipeptide/oligopeptide/nickel transport system permease component